MRFHHLVPALLFIVAKAANAGDLSGSLASMRQQHDIAVEEEFDFLVTPAQVHAFVAQGLLTPVWGNADYVLSKVSFPYARPDVKLFIERLGAQYRAATGKQLVITSLTRPVSRQPGNAHELSVHPAGMALDLRVPTDVGSRNWLENTLLAMENDGVLDVTREFRPSHYHIAVFPAEYRASMKNAPAASLASSVPAGLTAVFELPPEPVVAQKREAPLSPPLALALGSVVVLTGGAAVARRRR